MKFLLFVLCTMFLLFVISPSSVSAQPLTLPQTFQHDGLTFSQPLTIITPSAETLRVQFGEKPKLAIKKIFKKEVLSAEHIITPTVTKHILLNPSPTSTPTPTPTAPPTPTEEQIPTVTEPAPAILSTLGGLDAEKLFTMSNEFRAARGLPPLQKHEKSCQLAASRAPEIAGEVASGNMHAGLRARSLEYWNSENIISMRSEEAAFNWWVNDKIHHDAIVGNYTYSCVACHGNSCAQEFTNFQPK